MRINISTDTNTIQTHSFEVNRLFGIAKFGLQRRDIILWRIQSIVRYIDMGVTYECDRRMHRRTDVLTENAALHYVARQK